MKQFCMDNLEELHLFLAYKDNTQQHIINLRSIKTFGNKHIIIESTTVSFLLHVVTIAT